MFSNVPQGLRGVQYRGSWVRRILEDGVVYPRILLTSYASGVPACMDDRYMKLGLAV